MEVAKPSIPCVDYWPDGTLDEKRKQAYKFAECTGEIKIGKVIYNRRDKSITFHYLANAPHEWMIDQLKKYVKEMEA